MSLVQVRTRKGKYINVNDLVAKPGSFVTIIGYQNAKGEVSDYTINGNISYGNAMKSAVGVLESLTEEEMSAINSNLSEVRRIRDEIVNGFIQKLNETEEEKEENILYLEIAPGLKYKDSMFYIWGLLVDKSTKKPVPAKQVKSRESTLIRQGLMALTTLDKYKQFVLAGNFDEIHLNKTKLGRK